nr:Golgi-associated plant pathogenesis-related protein 1 isoform X1 [Zootoca vivipara]
MSDAHSRESHCTTKWNSCKLPCFLEIKLRFHAKLFRRSNASTKEEKVSSTEAGRTGNAVFYSAQKASKQFAEEVLKAHNDYRKKHGVPSLKLCKKLNREAQQYSEALASTRILKHSPESSSGKCGENLAWASYDQSGCEVADRWYNEIKSYNFQSPGFSSGTGHFTAMVWKSTKKMGVGKAAASDGSTFVVARYEPAGNIVNPGHYEQNVLPPRK